MLNSTKPMILNINKVSDIADKYDIKTILIYY